MLKTDDGTTHQSLATASQRICLEESEKIVRQRLLEQESELRKSFRRYTSYEYVENILRKMRNLLSKLKAWLLRTRTPGGVCRSFDYVILGAPSILIRATLFKMSV